MNRRKDEEDPAEPRFPSPNTNRCIWTMEHDRSLRVLYEHITKDNKPAKMHLFMTILDKLADLKEKVESFWEKTRLVLRAWSPWWDIVLVISCVIAISLDPLFFYIPTINGEEKCLEMDTSLRTVSLVLRSFTDIIFILDMLEQISKAATKAERWWPLASDFLCILPAPQVLIVVIFYKNRDFGYLNNSKIMNVLLLIQYAPRIYRLNQSFDNLKRKNDTGLWVKIAFNFFRYILACHILGASWFFFSIQREILCWYQVCTKYNTCGSYFKCNENSSRDIRKLVELCPMNPPDSTVFDFGIFVNPLGTSSRTPINFSTKFSYSFWWGVRNLSNFGTNLETSTYVWEYWFASLISIIGLLLFLYLIGNNVQTYMQMKTKKAEDEAERIRLEAERRRHQQTRINLWLQRHGLYGMWEERIELKMEEKYKENKDVNYANVLTLLSLIRHDYYEKWLYVVFKIVLKSLKNASLENVPVLQDMTPDSVFFSIISKRMGFLIEIVEYPENTWIVEMDKPLDRMFFITEGTMGIYNTSGDPSSPSAVIQGSFEEYSIYGHEQLLSWVLPPNPPDLDRLPISKEAVKCHTKVEGFVLTASDLKTVFCDEGIIREIYSDEEDDAEDSNCSSLGSSFLVATAVSRFRRRLRRKKPELHLDLDPSSFKGL